MTSRQGYSKTVCELSRGKHVKITALPISSNVGEPGQKLLSPLTDRLRRLVVFGSWSTRQRVFERGLDDVKHACQVLELEKIIDIGPSDGMQPSQIGGIEVERVGEKTAAEVSVLLTDSVAGFFDYPPEFLAKSGVFAAYCAHALLPVGSGASAVPADGLEAGKHYWLAGASAAKISLCEGQLIADNACSWYQKHALSIHASTLASFLK